MSSTNDKRPLVLLATVQTVAASGVTVVVDGSVGTITVVDCCGAQVGDRVVLQRHVTQLLAVAIVGGPHGTGADYVTDTGIAQGWYYQLHASGYIHAWRNLSVSLSTAGVQVAATVTLPCTMADTAYCVTVGNGNYMISETWEIYADRTTGAIKVGINVATTSSGTTSLALTLDGFVNGAVPPSGDRLPDYTGATSVTPSEVVQVLPTDDTSVLSDITIAPIPQDYGRIARSGPALTVS